MKYSRTAVDPCSWDQIFDLNLQETPWDIEEIQKALDEHGHKWQEWRGSIYFSYFEIERNTENVFTVYLRGADKISYPVLRDAPYEYVVSFIEHAIKKPHGGSSKLIVDK